LLYSSMDNHLGGRTHGYFIHCKDCHAEAKVIGGWDEKFEIHAWNSGKVTLPSPDNPWALHTMNGPTIAYEKHFYNGKRHREDGPAYLEHSPKSYMSKHRNGKIRASEWWINDIRVYNVVEWLHENKITWPFNDEEQVMFKLRFC
jgi:hypothetical protein